MATDYVVQQGDYLAGLAKQFGIPANTIWNHPNNSGLRQKRPNPNVLFPGDHVFIPDLKTREQSCSTDKQHQFQTASSKLRLRLTLENQYLQPIANAKCVLGLESDSQNLTTDGSGKIEQIIAPGVQKGFIVVQDPQCSLNGVPIAIKVGHLDPVEEVSGQTARLNNLGYFAGDVDNPDQDAFLSAVEEFQCDFRLKVDGICGPNTQAKLKQVHGC